MAENDDLEQEELESEEQQPKGKSDIRDLRRRADDAAKFEKENAELRAQIAAGERAKNLQAHVATIGVPEDQRSKFLKLAEKLVDGEPDEAALRGLAEEYGFLKGDAKAEEEARRMEQAAGLHRTGAPAVVGKEAAVAELRDLSDRIMKNDPTITKEQIIAAAAKAGVTVDNSAFEVGGIEAMTF